MTGGDVREKAAPALVVAGIIAVGGHRGALPLSAFGPAIE
jgi:hypothetical protein